MCCQYLFFVAAAAGDGGRSIKICVYIFKMMRVNIKQTIKK